MRAAIEKAVAYLQKSQKPNGTWPEYIGQDGGMTSLCALALLNAGVAPSDPSVKNALAALRALEPKQTYSVSLQTMVFCAAEPKKDVLLIRRNAKWLEETQIRRGPWNGGWSYPGGPRNRSETFSGDNSNSQFALLALYEAERAGVAVSEETWKRALNHWLKNQNSDGSWGYKLQGDAGMGSMTCAGIASVIIAQGALSAGDAQVIDGRVECCGKQQSNDAVENALNWLSRNFSVERNPGAPAWLYYYLYGVERAGRMTNRRFIGAYDWYREGADYLVHKQDDLQGFWPGEFLEKNHDLATSLALLFLAKGRRPVLIAKVKHGNHGGDVEDWNHHRSDLSNLTSYVEKRWQRDLTWQIVDPAAATVEDLLQSPVLFLHGKLAPRFGPADKIKLRDYVDRGGFIFAVAGCGGDQFEAGFRKLMEDVFPEQEYKLRLLTPDHPIWHAEEPVNPEHVRPLWGIDLGCRTSVVLCPDDLSCYWELSRPGRGHTLPEQIAAQVTAANSIGINVLAYATNRELKYKYDVFQAPKPQAPTDSVDRGTLHVARLAHGGGCNSAPGALINLMRIAGQQLKIRASGEPIELAILDPKLFDYHVVFMHGRRNFRLTPKEQTQLRTYLERGGMLFADAICSSPEFNDAFRREMAAIFPDRPLARIAITHPLFSPQFGGQDIRKVERRQPENRSARGPVQTPVRQVEPVLEGIKLGERYAVILSPYDVSCALENHESLDCAGYVRKDAARIAINVLLYSLHE